MENKIYRGKDASWLAILAQSPLNALLEQYLSYIMDDFLKEVAKGICGKKVNKEARKTAKDFLHWAVTL